MQQLDRVSRLDKQQHHVRTTTHQINNTSRQLAISNCFHLPPGVDVVHHDRPAFSVSGHLCACHSSIVLAISSLAVLQVFILSPSYFWLNVSSSCAAHVRTVLFVSVSGPMMAVTFSFLLATSFLSLSFLNSTSAFSFLWCVITVLVCAVPNTYTHTPSNYSIYCMGCFSASHYPRMMNNSRYIISKQHSP